MTGLSTPTNLGSPTNSVKRFLWTNRTDRRILSGMKTVFVVKYALTKGIIEAEVEADGMSDPERYVWVKWPRAVGGHMMFRRSECFDTEEAAEAKFNEIVKARQASLMKQIRALDNAVPKVVRLPR